MINALLNPSAYPDPTNGVELAQTQMSIVFITDTLVYKIKKPVDLGYLDYTTLERRHHFCEREVELNRRLSPDIYLGVVPITRDENGYQVEGKGEIVEWAVKMRRLPLQQGMDTLLGKNRISDGMIDDLAKKLTKFHQQADVVYDNGGLDVIRRNTDENFAQTEKYIGRTLSETTIATIKSYTQQFINEHAELLQRRVDEGRIRDGHGDLHTNHICFTNGITIYDCIEFNDRFRQCDVASEVAFLTMDMDHFGRADLSYKFVEKYLENSNDEELSKLITFYKCYLSYVRGKVDSFKADDPNVPKEEKREAEERAVSYFDLSLAYAHPQPLLVMMMGLIGTGKSHFAHALATRVAAVIISSDVTRKKLAKIPLTEPRAVAYGTDIYAPEFTRKTYDRLYLEASNLLEEGRSVILDASFLNNEERERAKQLATDTGAYLFIIECILDKDLAKQRIDKRWEEGAISDGRWEIYRQQTQQQVKENNIGATIDTAQPIKTNLRKVLDLIYGRH